MGNSFIDVPDSFAPVSGVPKTPVEIGNAISSIPTPRSTVPGNRMAPVGADKPMSFSTNEADEILAGIPEAKNLKEAWKAGWQGTGTGLQIRQELPEFRVGKDTPFWPARASAVAGLLADFPLMAAAGIVAGAVTTPLGGAIAAGAIPAAVRESWMQALSKGSIVDSKDFLDRLGAVVVDSAKSGATMGVMHKAGTLLGINQLVAQGIDRTLAAKIVDGEVNTLISKFANKAVADYEAAGARITKEMVMPEATTAALKQLGATPAQTALASAILQSPLNTVQRLGGQVVAGTFAGSWLNGNLIPEGHEFLDTSIALFGLHYVVAGGKALRNVYAKTGKRPGEVMQDVTQNPNILTDIFPTTPEVKSRESVILEGRIADPRTEIPEDASPVLKLAVSILEKPEATRTPLEVEYVEKVRTGSYANQVRGVASEATIISEATRKIQEMEVKAAETRVETKTLTPEQQEKLDLAQKLHEKDIENAKRQYANNTEKLTLQLKDLERRFATEKRHIAGELTTSELARREAEIKALTVGKEVVVNGKDAVIVKADSRNAIVKFTDGTTLKVLRKSVAPRPITVPEMTVGMTPKEVEEYQFLKTQLGAKDIGSIANKYGLALAESSLIGALPKSVAEDPVFLDMRAQLDRVAADLGDKPKDWAEATARVTYAFWDARAQQFTNAGMPETVESLLSKYRPNGMKFVSEGSGELAQTPAGLPMWTMSKAVGIRMSKAIRDGAISLFPKASLARRNYAKLDKIFEKYPNPLESEQSWNEFMTHLVGEKDILGVPENALKYAQSPQAVADYLSRLRPDQLEGRRSGFALGKAIRDKYIDETATPVTTGRLLLWGILSRSAGAYPHEAAYMDLVNAGVDKWILKAARGEWTEADTKGYDEWSRGFMATRKGGVSPAAQVTSNANDFGSVMLSKIGVKDASGKSLLVKLHEVMADQKTSTDEVRRSFFALGDGLGIQNKVLSFALLVTGRWDTMVLDRVQFTHMWGEKYKQKALASGVVPNSNGVVNIYDNPTGGLAPAGEGHFGLAIYEALNRGLTDSVKKGYELAGMKGEGDGTLGAFHWDSWLVESSQAIGHPTIEALTTAVPRADLSVKQGKFDTMTHGFEYRADGQYLVPLLDGSGYRIMSAADATLLTARLGDKKEGVIPEGFKVSQHKAKPWTDSEGVNRERYDAIASEFGRPATTADVSPEKLAALARRGAAVEVGGAGDELSAGVTGERGGRYQGGSDTPLEGAPLKRGASGPIPAIVSIVERYANSIGLRFARQSEYAKVDIDRARRIADAYEAMPHAPQDPAVKEAYENLAVQTRAQYDALVEGGYKFTFFDSTNDPYAGNPMNAMRDLRANKSMAVYGTYDGFGTRPMDVSANPLLADTGLRWADQKGVMRPVTVNDMFRAVHDALGHGLEGADFRAQGEENAWQAHARLYTGSALAAMTNETRGQNSWVNYGPHGENNRTAKVEGTVFADQKTGLMPEWTWTEGKVGDAGGRLFQSMPPVWYSALDREVAKLNVTSSTASGWTSAIKGLLNKGLVKATEVEAVGLEDYLKLQSGKITKEQLTEFLAQKGVKVEEVMLGRKGQASEAMRRSIEGENNAELSLTPEQWLEQSARFERTAQSWQRNGDQAQAQRYFDLAEEANRLAEGLDPESGSTKGMPKFAQWQLPGGENYRELLLTLPGPLTDSLPGGTELFIDGRFHGRYATRTDAERSLDGLRANPANRSRQFELRNETAISGVEKELFRSSHFDQPNILAHIRFNERTDAAGKRVLFIEEIQSDWAQKGKKEGFKTVPDAKLIEEAEVLERAGRQIEYAAAKEDRPLSEFEQTSYMNLNRQAATLRSRAMAVGVPSAPFVGKTEAWVALSMKRMIRYAAENGFDRVAWTNGEQQAARYNLSKQIDRIDYHKGADGWNLSAIKDGAELIAKEGLSDAEVEAQVGKDILSRMKDGKGDIGRSPDEDVTYRSLTGLNLEVGGEGMKAFYDRIVPNVANDILKKLGGGRVGESRLTFDKNIELEKWVPEDGVGDGSKVPIEVSTQLSFDITPALRERTMQGMPLFQENRGFYAPLSRGGNGEIGFLKGSDPSTTIHESWHFFFDVMVDMARDQNAPAEIKADVQKMFDYVKVSGMEEWSALSGSKMGTAEYQRWVDAHETMARSGESYVMSGDFPIVGLRSVFSKFKEWLTNVYQTLDKLGVNMTPEIRGVFDRMIGADAEALKGQYAEIASRDKGIEIMPGFKAEQVAIQPYPDMIYPEGKPPLGKINIWRMNSQEDIDSGVAKWKEDALLRSQEVYEGEHKSKSWSEANNKAVSQLNDIMNDGDPRTASSIMEKLGGTGKPVDETFVALTAFLNESVNYQVKLRETLIQKWADSREPSAQEQLDYLTSIERTHMIFSRWKGERSAIGRALNQMKQTGNLKGADILSDVQWLKQSGKDEADFVKQRLEELLNDYKTRFRDETMTVKKLVELDKQNQSMREQARFNEGVLKSNSFEKFIEFWKAWGLLSGPLTTVVNIAGTLSYMGVRPIVDLLSAGFGMARGAEVGQRQSMIESVERVSMLVQGFIGGAKAGAISMKTEQQSGKVEQYAPAIEGKLGLAARLPYRLMSGGDVMTQYMYRGGELRTLASREAIRQGEQFGTAGYNEKVASIMLDAREGSPMWKEAETQAARMAFNEEGGRWAGALSNLTRVIPALNILLPFKRTPLNVLDEMIHISPFAPLSKTWRDRMKTTGIESDRAKAEWLLGSAVFATVIAYAATGNITGNGPPDPGKKKTWLADHDPYSIKIGDKWYGYAKLQPVGTLIGIAADMAEIWDHAKTEDNDKILKMVSFAFANAVTNQTFMKGLTDFTNAMSDPDRYGPQYAHSFIASSLVPSLSAQIAAMKDPHAREVYTTLDAIKNRLIGVRETLQPKIDWVGEPKDAQKRLLGVLPITVKDVSEDMVLTEASRLGISVPTAPKKAHLGRLTGKLGEIKYEPEERTKYAEESGKMAHKILSQIVNSDGWKSIPETTPQEIAVKKNIFLKVLASSHKYGAIVAMPPEKRAELLNQIYQKFSSPVE